MKKPSRVMVKLASREGVLVKAPKPMELEARVLVSISVLQEN